MTINETVKDAVKKFDDNPEALRTLLFATLFGYFGMGTLLMLMSKAVRHRLAGFIMEAWGVISGFSPAELATGAAFWLFINIGLYAVISIMMEWRAIWEASKHGLSEPGVDILASKVKWFSEAILYGPAYGREWIEADFAGSFITPKGDNSSMTGKVRNFQKICMVFDTYADMRRQVATNRLTWVVYLLGALGVLLPGIYPFVHALKVNIAVTAEGWMEEEGLMKEIESLRREIEKRKALWQEG